MRLFKNALLLAASVLIFSFSLNFLNGWMLEMSLLEHAAAQNVDLEPIKEAPPLTGGHGWLNVERPLRLEELRGKVVLLDFWTYCCINCLHILPDLKRLEEKYADELVVIGVHSAKFTNEQESANIRQAILRYDIRHPVINDADFELFTRYEAGGWPHLVLIDPAGKIVATRSGEGHFAFLDQAIAQLIDRHAGQIDRSPIPLKWEQDARPDSVLSFPGKVLADAQGERLFIADTSHNRIVVATFDGTILEVVGGREPGLQDGRFAEARFHHPQGMHLLGESLYVADQKNHAIRRIDFDKRMVETAAGTGEQSYSRRGGPATETGLNSPWALTQMNGQGPLYIAMAGSHQIWTYDPQAEHVEPFAGTGREAVTDRIINQAALAQPSGLTHDGEDLYFADSESSSLRMIDFSKDIPLVQTLIGEGLFEFGDIDGPFPKARLQHVLGIEYHDDIIYLADTYNHKIKAADLSERTIRTVAGTGQPGVGSPDAAQFAEPSGLSIAGGRLFIADTNNHAIRVMQLPDGPVSTLNLDYATWQKQQAQENTFSLVGEPATRQLAGDPLQASGELTIRFSFPDGYGFNQLAQPLVQFRYVVNGQPHITAKETVSVQDGNRINLTLEPPPGLPEQTGFQVGLTYFYCRTDHEGQCYIGSLLINGQIEPKEGRSRATVNHQVQIDSGV